MHTDGKNKTHNHLKHNIYTTELELQLLINLKAFSSTFGLKIIFKKNNYSSPTWMSDSSGNQSSFK